MSDDVEREIDEAAYGRRTFLRRLALGSAFAVPVVSSFSMAGINAVSAHAAQNGGYIGGANQTSTIGNCNQTIVSANSTYGNGGEGNGIFGLINEVRRILIQSHGQF